MNPNEALIERFYGAFGERDGDTMASLYAPDARFHDPVFEDLMARRRGNVADADRPRRTTCASSCSSTTPTDGEGSAHWRAHYTFAQTGRPVVNDIQAKFRFRDGQIAEHVDDFSFYRWARQALGPPGLLLGWTPVSARASAAAPARGWTSSGRLGDFSCLNRRLLVPQVHRTQRTIEGALSCSAGAEASLHRRVLQREGH